MAKEGSGRKKIGFVVNPIAGMGGKVALKGTDGVVEEAVKRGAVPISHSKATHFLSKLKELQVLSSFEWLTAAGEMGESALNEWGAAPTVSKTTKAMAGQAKEIPTTSRDTVEACESFLDAGAALVIFVGGDGTARDVHSVVQNRVPILGVPSGVKMHSGVFGVTPEATAELLKDWLDGKAGVQEGELIDLDEDAYRAGEWRLRHTGLALTLFEPSYAQVGKEMFEAADHADVVAGIAEHVMEISKKNPETLFILGPGSTVAFIAKEMGIDKTLLGVDCILGDRIVASDVGEGEILSLLDKHPKAKIIVSPIGAQGFVFGRGNLQLSARVLARMDILDIIVVATPAKLAATPVIRVDMDDPEIVDRFNRKKYIQVVIGYHTSAMRKLG